MLTDAQLSDFLAGKLPLEEAEEIERLSESLPPSKRESLNYRSIRWWIASAKSGSAEIHGTTSHCLALRPEY